MITAGSEQERQTAAVAAGGQTAGSAAAAPVPPATHPSGSITGTLVPQRAVFPLGLSRRDVQRLLAVFAFALFAAWFLWLVQSILPPFLIAFCLAALIDPWLRAEERRGHGRVLTILALYGLLLVTIVVLAVTVVPVVERQLVDFTSNVTSYYNNVQRTTDQFLFRNSHWLNRFGITYRKMSDIISQKSGPIKDTITVVLGGITGFLAGAASRAIWFVIIPIAGFFFMRDFPVLRARIIAMFPEMYHCRIDTVSTEVVNVFSDYLRGLGKICLLYGFVMFVMFEIVGLQYALFLGMLAGIFYAVPYAGQLVTATVSGAVAYSMEAHTSALFFHFGANSFSYTVGIIGCVILMNNIFDQLVYPRVVGGSVGLHPVASIFALACGATLFGIGGMLLAVPVAASIQIILVYAFPRLRQPPPPDLVQSSHSGPLA